MKKELFTMCSYCKRFEDPKTEKWKVKKPEKAVLGLKGNVTDSICPDCQKKIIEEVLQDEFQGRTLSSFCCTLF